jgi:phosphoribosyl 1,2-cyclic phosphodiesterase
VNLSVLASGSKGNAILIWEPAPASGVNNQPWALPWAVLIDCGLSASAITGYLKQFQMAPADVKAILISHAHGDHWQSLLPFWKKCPSAIVYAHAATIATMRDKIGEKKQFPGDTRAVEFGKPFPLSRDHAKLLIAVGLACEHNAEGAMTFCVKNYAGRKVAIFNETGKITPAMWKAGLGAQVYCIEMNHDQTACLENPDRPDTVNQRTWATHVNNDQAALAIQHLPESAHTVVALHLSGENNDPELVRRVMAEANSRRRKRLDAVILSSQEFATRVIEV